MERSNTGGAQFRSLHEDTRTANAGIPHEFNRLRAREVQFVTEVSTTQNQETELQGHLLNLHQEIARINALSTSNSDYTQFDEHWKSRS